MRVLVTAMKNSPSKRGSRLSRACSQTRRGGRAVDSGEGMRCRLAPRRRADSPDSDIDAGAVEMDDQERVGDVTPTYEPTFHGRRSGLRARRPLIFRCPPRSSDTESSAQPPPPSSRRAGHTGAKTPPVRHRHQTRKKLME